MCAALKNGAVLGFGIEHPNYSHVAAAVPAVVRNSLAADLD